MPIHDLKAQIARLPEQPGVYLYFNDAGETIYVGKARVAARPRPQLPGRLRHEPAHRRAARRGRSASRSSSPTRSSRRWRSRTTSSSSGRRSYNILLRDDKNYPYLQLTTGEAFPRVLVARRVERDGHFYAGPFLPASLGAADDGADAPAVRHPVVQRGHHRRARPAVPRVRHQALPRAVRRAICSPEDVRARRSSDTRLFLEGRNDELVDDAARPDGGGGRRRALRAGGAAARRDPHGRDAARPAAEDGDAPSSATATRSA